VESTATSLDRRSAAGFETDHCPVASAISLRILDPLQDNEWDRLVISHPDYTFFHSAAWAKVLTTTYRHKPFYLHFSRRDQPVALVPFMEIKSRFTGRRGVSLPFSDSCSPLVFDQSESERVIATISKLAREREWKYVELRGGREMLPAGAVAARQFYGHKLVLSRGADQLLVRFAGPVRRAIRKAEKSGLTVQVATTREAVREYYRLHVRTRRRHGIPPQPLSFFFNLHRDAIEGGQGFIVLARNGGRCVAAAVFLQFGEKAVYKFGASNEAFQGLRGNNLVMWEAIRVLTQDGYQSLDFGRTDIENEGLRRYKMGWGTEETVMEYFEFDSRTEAWKTSSSFGVGFYNKIFRRSPLLLNRLAGSIIYPHLD
jgi:CelD/BcsL family acetyltransferase involved in cellulose biosynthesis